jgi:hypothetical protein
MTLYRVGELVYGFSTNHTKSRIAKREHSATNETISHIYHSLGLISSGLQMLFRSSINHSQCRSHLPCFLPSRLNTSARKFRQEGPSTLSEERLRDRKQRAFKSLFSRSCRLFKGVLGLEETVCHSLHHEQERGSKVRLARASDIVVRRMK